MEKMSRLRRKKKQRQDEEKKVLISRERVFLLLAFILLSLWNIFREDWKRFCCASGLKNFYWRVRKHVLHSLRSGACRFIL